MTALLTLARVLLAAIPQALIWILSKILTEAFVRDVIEDVLVFAIKKLVANTESNLDDQLAERIYIALDRNPDGSRRKG